MSEVTIIGVGLAKRVFQLHGAYCVQRRVSRASQKAFTRSVSRVRGTAAQMHDRHGGVRHGAWLGPGIWVAGARRAVDTAGQCEAVRQTPEE